ncbi:parathyroid hormone 4 isoform X2 [Lepisosteus oculatus]|uniref:parathyroid hormone 4 isoform X2 n=1 Tax=Lepisosteus oculatus TaxID=7918 RepID=UPI00371BF44E
MLRPRRAIQALIAVVCIVLALANSQESEKRAVTEHQYMHDKGRAMQSLKRLIWLSSAMGGLHTASTRDLSDPSDPSPARDPPAEEGAHGPTTCRGEALRLLLSLLGRGSLQALWSALYKPHLTSLQDSTDHGDGEN